MNKNLKKIFWTLSALAILCLGILYIPTMQNYAVELVERLKNDDINDVFWKQQMSAFATCSISLILIVNLILFTKKGHDIFSVFCAAVKKEFLFLIQNKKYFLFLAAIYILGYYTIIRGNFCYIAIDDLPRQLGGDRDWVNWYRYFDEFGSIFIHTSPRLIDIAPLTQFIAIFFVALASFMAAQTATGEKMGYIACIASLPIGLFPYFLTNMSYRYDSPYMALSVFACILPFIFKEKRANYIIASVIGLLTMCTSYQASSGIYIVMTALCALRMRKENRNWGEVGKFILVSTGCYIGSLLLFKFIFMEREFKPGGIDERMKISNIAQNAKKYVSLIWNGLGKSALKVCSIIIFALNITFSGLAPNRSKIERILLTLLFYIVCIPLSYGVYLAMGTPLWHSRALFGIGVFAAAAALLLLINIEDTGNASRVIGRLAIFAASYCCLAYAFAYGNAQTQQVKYAEFRASLLMADMSKLMPTDNRKENMEILFENEIGYAPATKNLISVYPLTETCVDIYAKSGRSTQYILQSYGFMNLVSGNSHRLQKEDLPVLLETDYHKIKGKNNHFLVSFKEPNRNVIRTRAFVEE